MLLIVITDLLTMRFLLLKELKFLRIFGVLFFVILSVVGFKVRQPSCDIAEHDRRFDCYPENGSNENDCLKRGCCWSNQGDVDMAPFCYFPTDFPNYEVVEDKKIINAFGASYQINKKASTFRQNEILNLTVDLFYESEQRLRVKIYDKNNARYEVPLDIKDKKAEKSANSDYYISIADKPFSIKVYRKSTGNLMCAS